MMNRRRLGVMAVCAMAFAASLVAVPNVMAGTFQAADSQEASEIRAKIQAAQFLSKATFGPTMSEIEALGTRITEIGYRRACEAWIDTQMTTTGPTQEEVAREMVTRNGHALDAQDGAALPNYRYEAWWHIALTSEEQLRQRVAWALSQIFAVGQGGTGFDARNIYNIPDNGGRSIPLWLGMSNFYDMLASHAFGNYRELLGDVTYHPVMGVWLSSVGNQKAAKSGQEVTRFPDENYAREIQQLFSVGIYQLHKDGRLQRDTNGDLIPTYDNDGITEMARVFTGMHYSDGNNNDNDFHAGNGQRNFGVPMVVNGARHDNNIAYADGPNGAVPQSKTIFKGTAYEQTYGLPGNRTPAQYNALPSAQKNAAAKQDIDTALDIVAAHPNVSPFISRLLIQRLVTSNPSRAYIRRVTSKWDSTGGDLGEVIKSILLDPELLRGQTVRRIRNGDDTYRVEVQSRGTEYTRLREPVNRATALIRSLEFTTTERPGTDGNAPFVPSPYAVLPQLDADFGQFPYRTPTVFNFYLPDYQTPELVNYTPSRRLPIPNMATPEFEILNATTVVRMNDRFKAWCRARWTQFSINHGEAALNPQARRVYRVNFDLADEIALAGQVGTGNNHNDYDNPAHNKGNMKDVLEHFDLLLCNGSMTEGTKRIIYEGLATTPGDGANQGINRVEGMLLAIVNSPDCAVEE